jgi:hypothetical protein
LQPLRAERSRHPVSGYVTDGFTYRSPYAVTPGRPSPGLASPTPSRHSVIAVGTWYRNINLLSIAYACRPRLRSRLTLSRLALLRNPWAFGGHVSHMSFVTRASILTSQASTAGLRRRFAGLGTLPYHSTCVKSVASAPCLSPVTLSAPDHLTSELLRTL